MLKQVQKTLFVSVVLFGSLASAMAAPALNPFSYRVEIPAANLTCDQEAAALGQRFAQASGLVVSSAVCQGTHQVDNQNVYTLVVSYQANAELKPYTAHYTNEGVFASYSDCLASLAAQEAAFQTNTGLAVLAAGCNAASIGDGFSPSIDGIGTPQLQLFSMAPAFESGLNDVPGIYDVYRAQLVSTGANIVLTDSYDIFYYAKDRVQVTADNITYYRNATECQTESVAAQKIFASQPSIAPLAICLASDELQQALLTVIWVGDAFPLRADRASGSPVYNSFDDCEQDKARLVQNDVSAGETTVGAICEENSDGQGYVAEIFEDVSNQ